MIAATQLVFAYVGHLGYILVFVQSFRGILHLL